MLNQRQDSIIKILADQGEKSVEDLMVRFSVSDMTIRRDLAALEETGAIIRTWGGARMAESGVASFTYHEKSRQMYEEKQMIGRKGASLVKTGDFIIIDTGSTTVHVARALKQIPGLTIYTCSFPIIAELFNVSTVTLVMLGGTINRSSMEVYGPLTEKNFSMVKADIAFLGVDAIGRKGQLLTSSMESARVSELLIEHSSKRVLVTDSSKWSNDASVQYGDLSQIDAIITDSRLKPEYQLYIKEQNIELFLM